MAQDMESKQILRLVLSVPVDVKDEWQVIETVFDDLN
jgi:hypothetical protein